MSKGSNRRPGTGYADNYDAIFRKTEPQPKTCQHCKHWESFGDSNTSSGGHCYGEPLGFVGHMESFFTPADFGCNRWEAKV